MSTFVESFEAAKGVRPQQLPAADHSAAFKLVAGYGVDEACDIVRRAMQDNFVATKNPTLRFIASKPDTWRGTRATVSRNGHQPVPAGGSVWKSGLDATVTGPGERGTS